MKCISQVTFRKGNTVQTVPCGKCNFCLQNRRNDWTFRIEQEMRESDSGFFLTLTYNDENQPTVQIGDDENTKFGTLKKKDFQDFMKRVRIKQNQYDLTNGTTSKPIKYYAVGEYGENTFRPHYHAIIFNLQPSVVASIDEDWCKVEGGRRIPLGHIRVGTCEIASIHYVTKYVIQPRNEEIWTPLLPPFSLISKGMGKAYLDSNGFHHKKALQNSVVGTLGKQRLPRYYADKIFSIKDREKLRELSTEQSDAIYWRTINELAERSEADISAARSNYDKIVQDRHEQIAKNIKNNQQQNEQI